MSLWAINELYESRRSPALSAAVLRRHSTRVTCSRLSAMLHQAAWCLRRAGRTHATGRVFAPTATGAPVRLPGPWHWSVGRVLIRTTSARKKAVRKGRSASEVRAREARPLFAAPCTPTVLRRPSTRAQYRHTVPHVPPGASRMGAVRRAW
ncbi:hypothetical protein B0H13DRAFT_1072983 [Mycena leptocephala]|nr:hypothetical protein B0H13DRAFT_1072983 [Mycena leptocephala]